MSTNHRTIEATPDRVWEVLADGWLYPLFVVGASRMRAVDATWPAVGAQLHHSVGTWPLLVDDSTEVLAVDERRHLRLEARAWPAGRGQVDFTLEDAGDGTTRVTLEEDATAGPGLLVPQPLRDAQLHVRNTETLQRLAFVVEGRTQ